MIVLQFLTEEYQRGFSFNYLSSYIAALRNYLPDTALNAYVIRKFIKEIFRLRPHKTKYHAIWDKQILLDIFLDNDMNVSRKLVCLSMVLSSPCVDTISKLIIRNMYLKNDECAFVFKNY